jgi:hypothetical protein
MDLEILEKLPALAPMEFFSIEGEFHYSKSPPSLKEMRRNFMLFDASRWLGEEHFADVAACWNESGLSFTVDVHQPFQEAFYPRFFEGDAIEIFLDTRDLKTAGFATRFCHHFLFLPQAIQGIQAQELTRFRTEDTHSLCEAADLKVSVIFLKNSYTLQIFIPAHCLHGYDPVSFERIGFTYRIHRFRGQPQHFSLISHHFTLEQYPRLWATFKCVH